MSLTLRTDAPEPSASPARPQAAPASPAASGGAGFARALEAVGQVERQEVTVERGDTLIGLVKAHYRQGGQPISEGRALREAHQIAARNGIRNPDLILPGQAIDFSPLGLPELDRSAALLPRQGWAMTARLQPVAAVDESLGPSGPPSDHPVLERTLQRAVAKGYLQAEDTAEAQRKILAMAQKYRFEPDDFARLSLMESGMNPTASNGSCHGIIQFCDGPGRGAAAVGFGRNPRAILGLGLVQQLDLVDRYFAQLGLGQQTGRLGLDDLYLSVLTPAARAETRPDAPLPIAGPQARLLHVGQDTRAPITRNSIVAGLHALTQALLPGLPLAQGQNGSRQYANVAAQSWRR